MHLTNDSYHRLLDGRLAGAEARALAAHLDAPCDACEAFLAERPTADGLDGRIDAALVALAPLHDSGADDLTFSRIERQLGRAPRRRFVPALAVAATLAVAGLAALLRPAAPPGQGWDGVKGGTTAVVPMRLRFVVLTPAIGGPPALEKGIPGQEVPATASLQFQLELGRAANVLLARAGTGGGTEVFFTARLEAGRHTVSVDGHPAAYPLAALAGSQRFLALASEASLGPSDAARAVASGAASAREGGHPITLDEVQIRVRP